MRNSDAAAFAFLRDGLAIDDSERRLMDVVGYQRQFTRFRSIGVARFFKRKWHGRVFAFFSKTGIFDPLHSAVSSEGTSYLNLANRNQLYDNKII